MVEDEIIDRDVFAAEAEDNDACGMVMKIRDGRVIGKTHFYFNNVLDKPAEEILDNLITNYYRKSEFIPDEVFIPLETENSRTYRKWLTEKKGSKVEIIIPKIGDKAKLVNMVAANAKLMLNELKLAKMKREYIAPSVESLKRDLKLNRLPKRIECFDISHIQGTDTVASMVVFRGCKTEENRIQKIQNQKRIKRNRRARRFSLNEGSYSRRFRRLIDDKGEVPDLVVIDGGKGQLSSAV